MARARSLFNQYATAAALIGAGAALLATGSWHLMSLNASFSRSDFVYGVSQGTTQLWLRELATQDGLDDEALTERIYQRFSNLTLPQRRTTVLAMGQHPFWVQAIPDFVARTRMIAASGKAAEKFAARAPLAGDVWYLAAQLRVMASGLDAAGERFVELSQVYAPKEVKIAAARLELAAKQGGTISARLRDVARRDYVIVLEAFPDQAKSLADALRAGGVVQ